MSNTKPSVAGKRPLSTKGKASVVDEPDFFTNKLAISSELLAELKSKGLDHRWIDYKQFIEDGNLHTKGWQPYKCESANKESFLLGTNPDGIIRRGSVMLAVRPMEASLKHRAFLRERARTYAGKKRKESLAELQQATRGISRVIEDDFSDSDED